MLMLSKAFLIDQLRRLEQLVGPNDLPVVRVAWGDERVDWRSLGCCTDCGVPGIDIGQNVDCRSAADGPEGLHAQWLPQLDVVEFHLDRVDACRDPAGHAAADTRVIEYLVGGALLGTGLFAALGGKILAGAVLGGLAGSAVGISTPARRRHIFTLDEALAVTAPANVGWNPATVS